MKLLIDAGNTRCKWALADLSGIQRRGFFAWADKASLMSSSMADIPLGGVDGVYISSVVGERFADDIAAWAQTRLGLQPVHAKVVKSHRGVTVAYSDVSHLGVDRWLALLAARERTPDGVIVINAGTTITVDVMLSNGSHQGGLIVPGISMMRTALFERTAAVKVEQLPIPQFWAFGDDTLPCVANGVSAMLRGFLAQVIEFAPECERVFVAGGDAKIISALLPVGAEVHENLVLEGLLLL